MIEDPIVEEVRKARDDYARQFDYDLEAIFRDLQKKEQQPGKKAVSFPPKRPKKGRKSACTPSQSMPLENEMDDDLRPEYDFGKKES